MVSKKLWRWTAVPVVAAAVVVPSLSTAATPTHVLAATGTSMFASAASPEAMHVAQVTAAKATPWSPWLDTPKAKPWTEVGCRTKLTVSEPVSRQEARFRTDRDGNDRYQVRGTLHWRINPERGHTVVVDVSGPGRGTVYRNNDAYYQFSGRHTQYFSRAEYRNSTPTKLPRLFLSKGPFSLFFDSQDTRTRKDDQWTVLDQPDRFWNICDVLKNGVVPKPFRV
jgi:hypothetical protein